MTISAGRWRRHLIDVRPLRTSAAFRGLWAGTTLGSTGQQIAAVAVLAAMWQLTGSTLWMGAIGLATGLPMLVLGLVGGALADRADRRLLVVATTAGQLLSAVGLVAVAATDAVSPVVLLLLVAAQASCGALGSAARRTFPARLLVPDQVPAGVALQNVAFQVSMMVGPALAGVVIAVWSTPAAFAVQAGCTAVSLGTVLRLPSMPVRSAAPPDPRGDGRARRSASGGWVYVLRRPTLWGSFAVDLASTLPAMPIALFPAVNEARFGGDPRTLGLFLSAIAVGGMACGLLSGAVARRRRAGMVQICAALTWSLALAGFGLSTSAWLALTFLALAGAADTASVITRAALVQLETPEEFRGRVSSVEHVVGAAGPDLGNLRAGLVASVTSAPVALVSGGLAAACAVSLLAMVNRPLRHYSRTSLSSRRFAAAEGPGVAS